MVLYLIGLGLGDAEDITVKGLAAVRRCSRVYLEVYTSILTVGKEKLVRGPDRTGPDRTGPDRDWSSIKANPKTTRKQV
ncbi:unnamed protein product [Knipowitschia caucasica]